MAESLKLERIDKNENDLYRDTQLNLLYRYRELWRLRKQNSLTRSGGPIESER